MLPSEIDNQKTVKSRLRRDLRRSTAPLWEEPRMKWADPALSSIIAWGQKAIRTLEYYLAPFHRNPTPLDAGSRFRLLAFWLCNASCPGRVLAQSLSVHHIATPVTTCSSLLPEFQPHRLVAECITTNACTS